MNKKSWILLFVWFVAFITTVQFFRLKFGVIEIGVVYLVIGIPVVLFFAVPRKPKSNSDTTKAC